MDLLISLLCTPSLGSQKHEEARGCVKYHGQRLKGYEKMKL